MEINGIKVRYIAKDYTIIDGVACIDANRIFNDFYTYGVGVANPYVAIAANPSIDNWGQIPTSINCYAFAIGHYAGINPGSESNSTLNTSIYNTVETVAEYVIADLKALGRRARIIAGPNAPIFHNERRIAVRVSSKLSLGGRYDYHFMAQNSDGTWSEKHGANDASISHSSGNPNTLPWTLNGEPYYDSNIIYLAITN